MARDWESEFTANAKLIDTKREALNDALVELLRSRASGGIAPAKAWDKYGEVSNEWETALAKSRALIKELRESRDT